MRRYVLRSSQPPRRNGNHNPPPPPPPAASSNVRTYVTYMECQKNQAERVGGLAYDGCREFMATGPEGTPAALICAACQCNRRFHRLVVQTEVINDEDYDADDDDSSSPPPPPPPPPAQGAATA